MTSPPLLLLLGPGYVARALARRLAAEGWAVRGASRSGAAVDGIPVVPFTRGRPLDPAEFRSAAAVLSSIPPDPQGDPVIDMHAADLAAAGVPWVGYLSTTAVYGDAQGGWVDWRTPVNPISPRARARVAAEAGWLALDPPAHVFRLSGIYGPGRSALDSVRDGTAKRMTKPGQVFNRIHVDDIVEILAASIARPDPGAIYDLADDLPCPPDAPIVEAARLLGVEPPPEEPFDPARLSEMGRSFWAECKRVNNQRVKLDLDVALRHPTYVEGLAACLAAEAEAAESAADSAGSDARR